MKNNNNKAKRRTINMLESLRDIGGSVSQNVTKKVAKESAKQLKALNKELIQKVPKDAINQIFGPEVQKPSSQEEALKIEIEKRKKAEKQIFLERQINENEKRIKEQRTNELRLELHAIMQEVVTISTQTEELSREIKIAAMQAPNEPDIYSIVFFTNLLEHIRSLRKKIENASTWLSSVNSRAQRQNYWSLYKQHGAKFLLSGEHYLTRSAG